MTFDPTERRPKPEARGWFEVPFPATLRSPSLVRGSAWLRGKVTVISALENAELPDGSGVGPQWHISVSRRSRRSARPRPDEVALVLRAFDMRGAEEDNHHPGNARHFWIPVDPAHRVDCQCKATETVVRESDGYTWTNPTEGRCRGCEFAASTGRPCPIHGGAACRAP